MHATKQKIITAATSYFMSQYTKHYLNVKDETKDGLPPPPESKKYLLYMHVPFCTMFCPYCSFNKFTFSQEASTRYFKRLREEMLHVKALGYDFDTLVIGGGTPLIDEEELIQTIVLAKKLFSIQSVSCESDPNHIAPDSVKKLVGLVDRLSIGVQTFDDTLLKKMGRYEKFGSGDAIYKKIDAMLGILPITSVDLIFNFPTQTEDALLYDLVMLQSLSPEQTSIYPLMSSSMVKNNLKKSLGTFSMENEYAYFNLIKQNLKTVYPSQQGWSYSKEKGKMIDEYIIDHEEYVGIGSGSFSFLKDTLYLNEFALDAYDERIATKRTAVIKQRSFPRISQMYYRLMVDLFNGKLPKKRFSHLFGEPIEEVLSKELLLLKLSKAIKETKESITTTEFGSYLFMVMMKEFYMGMDHIRANERKKIPNLFG